MYGSPLELRKPVLRPAKRDFAAMIDESIADGVHATDAAFAPDSGTVESMSERSHVDGSVPRRATGAPSGVLEPVAALVRGDFVTVMRLTRPAWAYLVTLKCARLQ